MANNLCSLFRVVIYINFVLIIYLGLINSAQAWDTEDYELFDLVEETNRTFYEVMGLERTASTSEIRRQYYKMSLKLHPDHNKEPNAEQQFRQLVSIAEVLRDENKRQKYDNILENGLPNWKHAIFYYRKVRKFGLLELCAVLFAIVTVGQYIVSWAMYLERKYEMEEVLFSKLKKKDRKSKKSKQMGDDTAMEMICEEVMSQLPKPRFLDLLPFAMVRGSITLVINIPHGYSLIRQEVQRLCTRPKVVDHSGNDSDVMEDEERIRKPRRKRILEIPTVTSECILESVDEPASNDSLAVQTVDNEDSSVLQNSSRDWTDEDIAALTKAMNKFPSGIPQRWEKIAIHLNRTLRDVTSMTKTLKSMSTARAVPVSLQGLTADQLSQHSVEVDELTEREPTEGVRSNVSITDSKNSRKGCDSENKQHLKELQSETNAETPLGINGAGENNDDLWTQVQQKALELALSHFPRGTEERWEKVAKCVPDKSVDECMRRYKRLVELVKKKKHN